MSLSKALDDLYGEPAVFLRRLRSELLLHKRTVYQLCKCTSLSRSYVYDLFRGTKNNPSIETCVALDEAMGRLLE